MPMLVTDSSRMKSNTNSEIIAPLCRKNRRRTICACERPTVSFCSRVVVSSALRSDVASTGVVLQVRESGRLLIVPP